VPTEFFNLKENDLTGRVNNIIYYCIINGLTINLMAKIMNRDLNTFKLIRPIMKPSLSFHASKRSVRVQYDKSGRLLISWKIIKKMSLKLTQLKSDDQSSTFKRLD